MMGAVQPRRRKSASAASTNSFTMGKSRAFSSAVAPRSMMFSPLTSSLAITSGTP